MRNKMRVNCLRHLHDGVVPINQGSFPLEFQYISNIQLRAEYIFILTFILYNQSSNTFFIVHNRNENICTMKKMCNEYICKNSMY